jgi:hypothetical protein
MKKGKEKSPSEMTTQELAQRLFPKKLKKALDEIAHEKDDKPEEKES